jgi:hypothetical protein
VEGETEDLRNGRRVDRKAEGRREKQKGGERSRRVGERCRRVEGEVEGWREKHKGGRQKQNGEGRSGRVEGEAEG